MTDTTPAEALAEAVTAERLARTNLAEVQQSARAEIATPENLGAARNRVEHAIHVREGRQQAADLARVRSEKARQQQAKSDAAVLLMQDADLIGLHDEAVSALEALVAGVQQHNALIDRAAGTLEAGNVPPLGWDRARPDGFDSANHAIVEQGNSIPAVTLSGVTLRRENEGLWARHPLKIVAEHHNLTDGQGKRLVNALGKDIPDALRDR